MSTFSVIASLVWSAGPVCAKRVPPALSAVNPRWPHRLILLSGTDEKIEHLNAPALMKGCVSVPLTKENMCPYLRRFYAACEAGFLMPGRFASEFMASSGETAAVSASGKSAAMPAVSGAVAARRGVADPPGYIGAGRADQGRDNGRLHHVRGRGFGIPGDQLDYKIIDKQRED